MGSLYDLARVLTATVGTGTLTLGAAVPPWLTFAQAGVPDGATVSYAIEDGTLNSEIGTGVYTASGTTLTRTVTKSSNSNSAINLSGSAQVYITARAEDLDIHNATSKATPVDADELGLIDSAASNVLKKLTWANLYATLDARPHIYCGSFTRDISLASGTQAITGVGFTPKALIFITLENGTTKFSFGISDAGASGGFFDLQSFAPDAWGVHNALVTVVTSGADSYSGVLSSFDVDGFTVSWTKTGTPTGTVTIRYLAWR